MCVQSSQNHQRHSKYCTENQTISKIASSVGNYQSDKNGYTKMFI